MPSYAQLAPLAILIPSIGAFVNFFWGGKLNERWSHWIGAGAAVLSFVVSLLLYNYLVAADYTAAVVNPPLLDGWIRIPSANLDIPWQIRVDTLSVTMMLVVTGVGSLIHIYAGGYMHGDPKFARFFAYLNMFLAFMLTLVMGNNLLMMFVGWEGVGLCSYLLIGFWWDKKMPEGWKNSNAARKAFIVNRVGDFGLLMGIFLTFWTFGTLNFYSPGEIANVPYVQAHHSAAETHGEGATAAEGEHGAEDEHGATAVVYTDNNHIAISQLGIFNQAEALLALGEGETLVYSAADGQEITRGREVDFGPFSLDIQVVITLITLFMLVGATGKSAQIPLFVWLPDAMAGPTPVSALIHAATMVTAGVYMMVRANVFYDAAPLSGLVVTLVGASTALMAGFIAVGQWDIKRVLAYSTISQLGFMVAAVGIGAYVAAMFHLVTHAVFKALLFLGSGSVIHGVEHGHHHAHDDHHGHDEHHHDDHFDPQDMRNMGGLASRMPVTFITYIIGTLALAGIPPLAGFWSKDEILADAWHVGFVEGHVEGFIALGVLLAAAGFTAFYMWRQIEIVFFGQPRTTAAANAPESGALMTVPLVILAIFTVLIGFINVPKNTPILYPTFFVDYEFKHFLEPSIIAVTRGESLSFNVLLALGATALGLGAIFFARSYYGGGKAIVDGTRDRMQANVGTGAIWSLAHARLYWDEIYFRFIENPYNQFCRLMSRLDWEFLHDYFHDTLIVKGFNAVGQILSRPLDLGLIDGAVNGVGAVVRFFSGQLRRVQTGYVRTYAVAVLIGVVAVVIMMLLPLIQNG